MVIRSRLQRVDIPEVPFHQMFFNSIKIHGKRQAMINSVTNESFTFVDIKKNAKYVAEALVNLGVEKGEIVIICVETRPELIWIMLGCSLAGCAASIVPTTFNANEIGVSIETTSSRFAFVSPTGLDAIGQVFARIGKPYRMVCVGDRHEARGLPIMSDLAFLIPTTSTTDLPAIAPRDDAVLVPFSSGIHGLRKGIVCTHVHLNAKILIENHEGYTTKAKRGECTMAMMPLCKQFSLEYTLGSLMNGAIVVTCNLQSDVHNFMNALEKYKIHIASSNAYILQRMCDEGLSKVYDLKSLKCLLVGTEAVTESLYSDLRTQFPSIKYIMSSYGMTEVGVIARSDPNNEFSLSAGKLASTLQLKIVDIFSGHEVGARRKGIIFIKGPTCLAPYLNNEKATREHISADGWRNTGDIGYYDEMENIYLVDKTKEMIKVHGYQVIPTELENVLATHPAVLEAAVVSIYDKLAGERPVAYVILKEGYNVSAETLREFVNVRVNVVKRIVAVHIAQMLPRSPNGRVLKRMLAEAAASSILNY